MIEHDQEFELAELPGCWYIVSSEHRTSGKPLKSTWKVVEEKEIEHFLLSQENHWTTDWHGWSVSDTVLGTTVAGRNSRVAKFVDGSRNSKWHGYPADIVSKKHDIPPQSVLTSWKQLAKIDKADMSRVMRGIECGL